MSIKEISAIYAEFMTPLSILKGSAGIKGFVKLMTTLRIFKGTVNMN